MGVDEPSGEAAVSMPRAHGQRAGRIVWIDIARGVALIAMAIYHFSWDLEHFGYLARGLTETGGWKLFARAIASSFLFLVGVSLVLGHLDHIRWRPFLRRLGLLVLSAAAITIVTRIATPEGFIFYGILHSIAVSSLIGLAFLRLPSLLTLLVAAAAIAAPFYLRSPVFDAPALWFVGLSANPPRSNDYVPLIPWIAPVLIGIALTRIAVRSGLAARLADSKPRGGAVEKLLGGAGRHSLAFYLIHQPVLFGLVYAASQIVPPAPPDPVETYLSNCERSCSVGNEALFCQRFCQCTVDRLMEGGLFDGVNDGTIDVAGDPRIQSLAAQCTAEADNKP